VLLQAVFQRQLDAVEIEIGSSVLGVASAVSQVNPLVRIEDEK
jgi:hypothetical protein